MRKFLDMDPDSFRGKIVLLVIDKVVIGAILALAFVGYSWWAKVENRAYEARLRETDLGFRRAEYVKELVPVVVDDSKNVIYRAHALAALVETGSVAPSSAVNLAQGLLLSNVLGSGWDRTIPDSPHEEYLHATMLKVMPEGIPSVLAVYVQTVSRLGSIKNTDPDALVLNNTSGFWIRLFKSTVEGRSDEALVLLNSDRFLADNLSSLDRIVPTLSDDEASAWSARRIKGARIVGNLRLLQSRNPSVLAGAVRFFSSAMDPEPRTNEALDLATKLIDLPRSHGIANAELSGKALEIVMRRDDLKLHRPHPGEERSPIEDRFEAMSQYLVWSCRFPGVSQKLEDGILAALQGWSGALKAADASTVDYGDNHPIEWALVRCLVAATTESYGTPPPERSVNFLNDLFSLSDDKLRRAGLVHYRDQWQEARR
jgi:hypothetical protein